MTALLKFLVICRPHDAASTDPAVTIRSGGLMYAGVFGTHSPNIRTFTATQIVATPLRTNVTEEVWSSTYGITDIGKISTLE